MKVVAIVGSIRKESYNLKLAHFIQKRYQGKFTLEILNIRELPFFDEDIENNPPSAVTEFKRKVAGADAVLWVTPEYNGTIPGVLGNAIDWLSRVEVMFGKPSWIVGATPGFLGTVKAQLHLREILFSLSSPLLPGNEVYVGAVHQKFNDDGELIDEVTVKFFDSVVNNFLVWFNQQQRVNSK
ncbi:NADPH-dependent FMN reductase [Alkalihalobacillus trypoxylicola]|uniref:NADPH-dependent FMN reductase n=1 Tax=Alkalihalobacillus trypoxylicola TaxID=519424 RepID=A0A162CN30_9BACI|nr:NADPH-dependent FMN reductase [Alkalihalobacillus trypoxylicola]KYG25620.1 NADPH-dependent FMN reductase [Alkalihalobacillus trypoxylicola]